MNEFEANVIERAKEWYQSKLAADRGDAINWVDQTSEELEKAIEVLYEFEQLQDQVVLVFVCF